MKQSGWEYELYWGRHISERYTQLRNDIRDKQCSLRRFPLDTESWREAVAMPARCTGLWLAGSSAREDLSTNGRSWLPPMRRAQRLGLGYLDIGGPVFIKLMCKNKSFPNISCKILLELNNIQANHQNFPCSSSIVKNMLLTWCRLMSYCGVKGSPVKFYSKSSIKYKIHQESKI